MSRIKIVPGLSLAALVVVLSACAQKPFATFDIPIDPSLVGSRSFDLAGEVTTAGDHGNRVTISVIDHGNYNQKNSIGSVVLSKERPEGEIHGSYERQSFIAVCRFHVSIGDQRMRELCTTKINGVPWKTLVFHRIPLSSSHP